jgi:putative multiple sugar transport system ATP-binding protein
MADYILEMNDVSKRFPGVIALDNVNFKVKRGEIHCLVGENGAGKSTLMKVLSGVYPHGTYTGEIVLNGGKQAFKGISDSEKAGIAIISQELALIPELPVYENIFFGHEIRSRGMIVDWNETSKRAGEMLRKVRVNVNPAAKVKDLGVGTQQLVEIAKALSKDVKLLILDEPTSSLSEHDSQNLLELLRELKAQGVTSVMISHKLREVIAIADTITVLRDGRTIDSLDATDGKVEENDIIKLMVGREIENIYPHREHKTPGEVGLEVRNWTVFDPKSGREILHNVNLNVRRGEIVGLAGLVGSGRTELALSIFGNTPKYDVKGELFAHGRQMNFSAPEKAMKEGIAYVTEDRKGNGLVLIQDIRFNITLANLKALAKLLVIDQNEEVTVANRYFDDVGIRAPSVEQKVVNLSGGNQQKVSIAKWLFAAPDILIMDEPTRGIDVGAKFEIYSIMNRLVEQGMGIVMISSELLEVIGMSDRIYVMSEGAVTGELPASEATEEKIMAMATV